MEIGDMVHVGGRGDGRYIGTSGDQVIVRLTRSQKVTRANPWNVWPIGSRAA